MNATAVKISVKSTPCRDGISPGWMDQDAKDSDAMMNITTFTSEIESDAPCVSQRISVACMYEYSVVPGGDLTY